MSRRANLRASDADRERIAERLRQATAEGRLLADELEERLERTFAARTYGELDAIVADLPGPAPVRRREQRPALPWLRPVPMILMLIFVAPVVFSMLLAAAVVVTTLFSTWLVFAFVLWFLFGYRLRHHRSHHHAAYRRSMQAYGRWATGRPGGPRPRPWV